MTTDFFTSLAGKMKEAKEELGLFSEEDKFEKIEKINPSLIGNWEYRDRQDFELGDITALADSIQSTGQVQPIIVVKSDNVFKVLDNPDAKYVIIAGYRRWLACKSRNISVNAIIRQMDFEQAIACLVSENEKETVSDYSKGMFYASVLKREGITRKSLYERLGIKKGVFDNFLSFSEVPKEIWEAVGFLKNVSARTSATIKLICQKGEAEKNAIIAIADKISSGIGEKKITALVNKIINENNLKVQKANNLSKLEFSKNIIMESKDNSIRVSFKALKDEKIEHLKEAIAYTIEKFISDNLNAS